MFLGHVGPPLPCNSIKLVDVAEMNYLAVNGEGEVRTSNTLLYLFLLFVDFFKKHVRVWFSGVCERSQCVPRLST